MNLTQAFWDVLHRFFHFRPIVLGCCDCKKYYYLTNSMVIDDFGDEHNEYPVIECPNCGLLHIILFARINKDINEVDFNIKFK